VPEELRERVAAALGWPVLDTYTLSIQSLRELVRPVDAGLERELTDIIRSERHILHKPVKRVKAHYDAGHGFVVTKREKFP